MARHILGVDVIPTNNDEILHLFDTSSYAKGLDVTCGRLEILVPGFRYAKIIDPVPYFNLAINAKDLELVPQSASALPALPDGIYNIKYSVSPNELVYTEFDFLRTQSFEIDLLNARCDIDLDTCTPSSDIIDQLKKLRDIEDYIKAAQGAVYGGDLEKGAALYMYARTLFERFKNC